MFGIIIYFVIILLIVKRMRSAAKKGKRDAEDRRRTSYGAGSAQPTYRQTSAQPPKTPVYRQAANSGNTRKSGADPGRVQQTLKRPQVQRPEAVLHRFAGGSGEEGGISFKGLPPGTDELELLIRHNRARERFLERSLESRER